jgi:hypothetical protein
LGIGDWGLGPIPNPQSPIPNPQIPMSNLGINKIFKKLKNNYNNNNLIFFYQIFILKIGRIKF